MKKLVRFKLSVIIAICIMLCLWLIGFKCFFKPKVLDVKETTITITNAISPSPIFDFIKKIISINLAYMLTTYQGLSNGEYANEQDKKIILDQQKEVFKNYWRKWRFANNNYVFIFNHDYVMEMHPTKPDLEGKNIKNFQQGGKYIFQELVKKCQTENEAVILINTTEDIFLYGRYVKELNWYICTEINLNQIDINSSKSK